MKKLLTIAALLSVVAVSAQKNPKGGYLGKRIIICAEGSYFPNYASVKDMLLSYNFQYGGNVHFITGRYTQFGLSYNMYALGAHERYREDISNANKIKGYQVGLTFRKFRENKGGLAPIGKFIDVSLNYHSDTYTPSLKGIVPYTGEELSMTGLSAQVGLGAQGIFWNRVVMNSGVRVGGPIYTIDITDDDSATLDYADYMKERLMYKDFFSAYFGIGIIL